MAISFVDPIYLWLLLVLPLVWIVAISADRLQGARRWIALGIRTLVIGALILSLAGAQVLQSVDSLTTVFLVDSSDSISPGQRAKAEQFITEALAAMESGDQAAIVVFGKNALVERAPSAEGRLGRIRSVPVTERTNIAEALRLGMALFPADMQKRIVLLSDGAENHGRALGMLHLLHARDIPIDVVPLLHKASDIEAQVLMLRTVSLARQGQAADLVAVIESTVPQSARLRFRGDNRVIAQQDVQLPAGVSTFTATVTLQQQGYHHYSVELIPQQDIRPQNNEAGSLINVEGPPLVLIVEGRPNEADQIVAALKASSLTPVVVPATAMPTDLASLADYETVMLVNVPSRDLPTDAQESLRSLVRDLGRGLIMVGGEQSFGIGGYAQTPIEESLPVYMDLRNRERYPAVSVAVVFDTSGSMSADAGGKPKLKLAAEGAARVVELLRDFDELTVIPFDSSPHNTYGPVSGSQRQRAIQEILARGAVGPGGGGINVHDSLKAAGEILKDREPPIRHILLLADGADAQQQEGSIALVEEYRQNGITTSVISVAQGEDTPFLKNLAEAGGGKFFLVTDASTLPDVVLRDAYLSLAPYLVEKTFIPAYAASSPILVDLEQGLPKLRGYNGTTAKEESRVVLLGEHDAPVLAQWHYGLGRSVAWTSDLKGKWAADWARWDEFPRFVAQMVGWTLPTLESRQILVEPTFIGSDVQLVVEANHVDGTPLTGLQVEAAIVGPGSDAHGFGLKEIGPGRYLVRMPSPPAGTYLIRVIGHDAHGAPVFGQITGLLVPYSPEYRQGQSNEALLKTLVAESGGRILSDPAEAFEHDLPTVRRPLPLHFPLLLLALVLLPLDVAVRRVAIPWLTRMRKRSPVSAQQPAKPILRPAVMQEAKPQQTAAASQAQEPVARQPLSQQQAKPDSVTLDEIHDPLERLRAAKARARRR